MLVYLNTELWICVCSTVCVCACVKECMKQKQGFNWKRAGGQREGVFTHRWPLGGGIVIVHSPPSWVQLAALTCFPGQSITSSLLLHQTSKSFFLYFFVIAIHLCILLDVGFLLFYVIWAVSCSSTVDLNIADQPDILVWCNFLKMCIVLYIRRAEKSKRSN